MNMSVILVTNLINISLSSVYMNKFHPWQFFLVKETYEGKVARVNSTEGAYTLFQNGRYLDILLFLFKLDLCHRQGKQAM